ncbi:uncharacterized protein PV09_09327 [Verruconis gallopava]|uniref:Uncharacterized protein n=1 Tax=Verruconis gallopava TaxID=253628 RepID=A0A0D1YE03_9PEZI|nr:uncharacterized protein PV09_09327 [Verruconis gallopava]KIV98941.1 hypothetical protein PV09_09327 [Verruconis gallopava]
MIAPDLTNFDRAENSSDPQSRASNTPQTLPFPPLTKQHILNCAYNSWWPKYRSFTPKSRIIPLTPPFLEYLQADGIYLPCNEAPHPGYENEEDEIEDVAKDWRPLHDKIKATIKELGGKVLPKLNWSAPKDATHMLGNSMNCFSPDDVYLLLKSSDFITFDLNHAFDDTIDDGPAPHIPYHLVLRKSFNVNPSVEFRCFVRGRRLVGVSQRDMNYYDFLHKEKDRFLGLIEHFFEEKLKSTFEEENFVFDVYIPEPHNKVWLIDINPWAQRTDPLLFSWLELLTMEVPAEEPMEPVRFQLASAAISNLPKNGGLEEGTETREDSDEFESDVESVFVPELRLLNKDDPEAYGFASPQYSAHKMPKDVVDAAASGNTNALRDLSTEWQEALRRAQKADQEYDSEDEDGG